jgi:pimeloyl-ACP methyl ester carboxylesterase
VHGILTDGQIWEQVAACLSAARAGQIRIVLPDLPLGAHSHPVPNRRALTPAAVAAALAEILDAAGIPAAVLAGNDTGGAIAQIAAAAHPDRFPALMLTSCDALDHFPPLALRPLRSIIGLPGVTRAVAWLFSLPPLLQRPGPLNLLTRHPVDPALVASWMRNARQREIRRDFAAFFTACDRQATEAAADRLRSYPGPAVIAWSRRDRLFPAADAARLAAIIPHAQQHPIDDALTFSPLDQPQAVADAILLAMNGLPAGSPVG